MRKLFFLSLLCVGLCAACGEKDEKHPCYDASLITGTTCSTTCVEVCGCDGEVYCNECEANENGYSASTPPPCK